MQSLTGITIERFQMQEQIGQGGMAVVYKGVDPRTGRAVAFKFLSEDLPQDAVFYQRFQREVNALGQLVHPNIVRVLGSGKYQGMPFMVMDYLPGGTLRGLMDGPLEYRRAARLLAPVARALEFAHRQGLVHRDVKPSNILLSAAGDPVLSDFGIVRRMGEEARGLTTRGAGMGTPEYMAPEQATGGALDGRADVYALGVIFYEMVTGQKPYSARTPVEAAVRQATQPLPRPRQWAPDLPAGVEQVILKAMAPKPAGRYADMAAFAAALEEIAHAPAAPQRSGAADKRKNEPPPRKPEAPRGPNARGRLRLSPLGLVGGLAGLVCLALIGAGLWELFGSRPAAAAPTLRPPTRTAEGTKFTKTSPPSPTLLPSPTQPVAPGERRLEELSAPLWLNAGGAESEPTPGQALAAGSRLSSGANGGARVVLSDAAGVGMFYLYADSSAALALENQFGLELLRGAVFVQPAPGQKAEVKLPNHANLLATVSGSRMVVEARLGQTGVRLWCFEGDCRLEKPDQTSFRVPVGQSRGYNLTTGQIEDPQVMTSAEQWLWAQPCRPCLAGLVAVPSVTPSSGGYFVAPTPTPSPTSAPAENANPPTAAPKATSVGATMAATRTATSVPPTAAPRPTQPPPTVPVPPTAAPPTNVPTKGGATAYPPPATPVVPTAAPTVIVPYP